MSIRLSPKYGVNPSLMTCFYCGEDYGVALFGRCKDDQEAPRRGVFDKRPCPKCEEWMKQGIIFISTRDGESGDNPYRTGGFAVIKDDAIAGIITSPELRDSILKHRVAFIEDATWNTLGLPELPKR